MNRQKITEEWENFKKAPVAIIVSALIISALIWIFLDQFVYKVRLENYRSRIQLLKEQVAIYKDKKYIIGETEFSKLSNKELKEYAANKLKALTQYYQNYKMMDTLTRKYNLPWEEMMRISEKQSLVGTQMLLDYEVNHKTEVILLREQLLMRLPKEHIKTSRIDNYNHPTNPIGYKMMLDDFQKLVLILPDE